MPSFVIAIIFVAVTVIDQLTKYLVSSNMELGQKIPLIDGVLQLTYIRNDGAAFGKLDNMRWLFMIVSTLAIIGITVALIKYRKKFNNLTVVSLSLILSGGFSNMIDRTFYGDTVFNGTVIDFIDFCAFPEIWSYVFNVADSAVVVGTGIFIVSMIIDMVKEEKAKAAARQSSAEVIGNSEE